MNNTFRFGGGTLGRFIGDYESELEGTIVSQFDVLGGWIFFFHK